MDSYGHLTLGEWRTIYEEAREAVFARSPIREEEDGSYGEFDSRLVTKLIERMKISVDSRVLVLGCGVGSVVMQIVLQTGCKAVGVEPNALLVDTAFNILTSISERASDPEFAQTYLNNRIIINEGDLGKIVDIREHVRRATVVIMDNHSFDKHLEMKILRSLNAHLIYGSRLFTTRDLAPEFDPNRARERDELCKIFHHPWKQHTSDRHAVSWTDEPIKYFIYTRMYPDENIMSPPEAPPSPVHIMLPSITDVVVNPIGESTIEEWLYINDVLREKCIDDIAELLRYKTGESQVYGEFEPGFVSELIDLLKINSTSRVVDVGCGIGNVVFQTSAMTGCRSVGIEIRPELIDIGRKMEEILPEQYSDSSYARPFVKDHIKLIRGDATQINVVGSLFSDATIVIMNNMCFEADVELKILNIMKKTLKPGTRVLTTRNLAPRYRPDSVRSRSDVYSMFNFPWEKRTSKEYAVSWASSAVDYYIYTVKDPQS